MRILLVNPSTSDDLLSSTIDKITYLSSKAFFAPTAVATVAALTPPGHDVRIHDEQVLGPVEPLLLAERFDVVGISLLATQLLRTIEIVRFFREKKLDGALVVGGIGASHVAARLRSLVDALFLGEAEETWPEYLADLAAGKPGTSYQRATKPDLTRVPPPRWDLVAQDLSLYGAASVQTTRGCHFDCAFCDVIYTYGRTPRCKTVEQVLREVAIVQKLGGKMVYLADDNLCGSKAYAKELLPALVKLNNSFATPLAFVTQVDITVAEDEELLELMSDSNIIAVQIGIESVSQDSLREMNKLQNIRLDPVAAVRKIQSHGMAVMAHMIVGTDADGPDVFARTARFIDDACITHHMCHPLMAPPGTRLWYQLKREGRIVSAGDEMSNRLDVLSNILPRRMTRVELMEGLADYWDSIHEPARYLKRAMGFIDGVARKPKVKEEPRFAALWKNGGMLMKLMKYFTFQAPAEQRNIFFTIFKAGGRKAPFLMPRIIYAHTGYLIDRFRTQEAAKVVRAQAKFEKEHPESLRVLPRDTPLPASFREQSAQLFATAYETVRPAVPDMETLSRTVVESAIDFADRFGETFERLDDVHRAHLATSCQRVLGLHGLARPAGGPADAAEPSLPPTPPPGFAREMLDGLDLALRVRRDGWE